MILRIGICDDEEAMRNRIVNFLERFFFESEYECEILEYASGEALVSGYERQFDLLFLDIQMKALNGIDTAVRIRERDDRVCIVFITALEAYAKEGYKVRAYRYLTKPLEYFEFSNEMQAILKEIKKNMTTFITVKNDSGVHKIELSSIVMIEVNNRKITVWLADKRVEFYSTMKVIEKKINHELFVRSHQSFLLNMKHVIRVERDHTVYLSNGQQVPLSKSRKKDFMKRLTDYLGDML